MGAPSVGGRPKSPRGLRLLSRQVRAQSSGNPPRGLVRDAKHRGVAVEDRSRRIVREECRTDNRAAVINAHEDFGVLGVVVTDSLVTKDLALQRSVDLQLYAPEPA